MRKDMLIRRCLKFFAVQKIGMTTLLIIRRFLDDCCRNRRMTPTLSSYSCNFSFMSYSCLTRVSMDPRNKSEDDCSECMSEDDCYKKMSPSMTIMMWILVSSLTMTNMAYAECTPAPDCASIGYTETSCETTSLKCPFDTTKLKCMPCDSTFRYTCSGDNIAGGIGDTCNGKYASCECASGYKWKKSTCVESCTVGMIYYSDKSCSSTYDSSKTAIGVVIKDNELVMNNYIAIAWGGANVDIEGVINYSEKEDARTDYNGKANTAAIVAIHTSIGETSSSSAAMYCNSYSTVGTNAGDWYLPAYGEFYNYICSNNSLLASTMTTLGWNTPPYYMWTSSEYTAKYPWMHSFSACDRGTLQTKDTSTYLAFCVLPININNN